MKNIINFQYISAKREVSNKNIDKTLSHQTSLIYKKSEQDTHQQKAIEDFKIKLEDTDNELSKIYATMFNTIVSKVSKFGGLKEYESQIEIHSTLQHRDLLDGNTTVMYTQDGSSLPENYNGLGYMNLISMIFEIELIITNFKKTKDDRPADINLLFIEEPEAHTHPQMQYIFIKNIKDLLEESCKCDGTTTEINLQYIITTHSSHIVSESDFDDIKYFQKRKNSVIAKNLKDLHSKYTSNDIKNGEKNYRFLKQYLTLNRSELFFADKAILIEGDTERILLPAIMKKYDIENNTNLMSQNISIIEVGAYSQIFDLFIEFIGIKTLIITDIDSYYEQPKLKADDTPDFYKNGNPKMEIIHCTSDDTKVQYTSNYSLTYYHNRYRQDDPIKYDKDIKYFTNLTNIDDKILIKSSEKWERNKDGNLLLIYQIVENNHGARSFEDAFFNINRDFIKNNNFESQANTIKTLDKQIGKELVDFSEKVIESKPQFAIEILLNSDENFSNWKTPLYITQGLQWLMN